MAVDLRRFLSALTRSIISWSRAVIFSFPSACHHDAPGELVRTYLPAELTLSATDDAVSNVLSCLLVACGLGSVVSRVGIQPLLRPLDSAGVVEDVERSNDAVAGQVCRHGELERHELPASPLCSWARHS